MWIHVTWLGLLQSAVGATLLVVHVLIFGMIVWFLSGMPREHRTPSEWLGHVVVVALVALVDAAYLWWLRDSLQPLAGVLLSIMTLGSLKLMLGFLVEYDRKDRTAGRWARRLAVVGAVAILDACWLGWIPVTY